MCSLSPEIVELIAFRIWRSLAPKKELQTFTGIVNSLQKWFPSAPLNTSRLRKSAGSKEKLSWTPDLNKEYVTIKQIMGEHIKLSFISNQGPKGREFRCGGKHPLSCPNTFKSDVGMSPISGELSTLVFASTIVAIIGQLIVNLLPYIRTAVAC